jgi:hypothetical protein
MQLGNQATHRQSFSKLLIVVHAMRIPSGAVRSRFYYRNMLILTILHQVALEQTIVPKSTSHTIVPSQLTAFISISLTLRWAGSKAVVLSLQALSLRATNGYHALSQETYIYGYVTAAGHTTLLSASLIPMASDL